MTEPETMWVRQGRRIFSAALLGIVSGLTCVAVRLLFELAQCAFTGHWGTLPDTAAQLPLWRRAITPALGAAAAFFVAWASRRWNEREPFEEYVEAVRFHGGELSFFPNLWRILSSAFSIATGAAIGREGSMIQFAAAISSLWGRLRTSVYLPLAHQVAWGAAAAVAAVYQAPIAGAFFAAELVIGKITVDDLFPLLTAACIGAFISRAILGAGPLFAVHFPIHLNILNAGLALLVTVLVGLLGPAYAQLTRSLRIASRLPVALFWSGAVVGVLSLWRTEVWGNGDVALRIILQSSPADRTVLLILLLRLCATTFCVGTGTVGGVFTPTIFVGGAIGLLTGHLLHVADPVLFAIAGMGALLAAVTHAPLMAAFMTVELTGQWLLLPLLLMGCFAAKYVAKQLSSDFLYAVATPEPAREFDPAKLAALTNDL